MQRISGQGRVARGLLFGAVLACLATGTLAQTTNSIPDQRATTQAELDQLSQAMRVSDDTKARLTADIAALRKDHATITAALIQSAKTERKLADDMAAIADRLTTKRGEEAALRRSLWARRDVLADVLGGLERMGLNPPPALLVTPQDALSSVRSAILLGAVVPSLRQQADALAADLQTLSKIATSIQEEHDRLAETSTQIASERQRLTMLLSEKERLAQQNDDALAAERQRSEQLAQQASSLKDLLAGLEKDAAKRQADEAQSLAEATARQEQEDRLASAPIAPEHQLGATLPLDALKGKLALPVSGRRAKRFGDKDPLLGRMMGDTVATQSGSIVTSPVDANVLYAGPFRSYKQLLIMDAGDGYLVVLAGMGRITVAQGQSVLAGEPVGAMDETRQADASGAKGTGSTPELYIEFRKDGKSVDPDPWWAGA